MAKWSKNTLSTTTLKGQSWADKNQTKKAQRLNRKMVNRQQKADIKYKNKLADADLAKQRERQLTIRTIGNAVAKNIASYTAPKAVNATLANVNQLVNSSSGGTSNLKQNQKPHVSEEDTDNPTETKIR